MKMRYLRLLPQTYRAVIGAVFPLFTRAQIERETSSTITFQDS
jgi:hypothetical protein